MKKEKLKVGVYGITGCAGCLLTVLYEECFKELIELVDLKAFPLIRSDNYKGNFDYIFIEGTVCFDEDIIVLNELRKRTKYIVALGACSCTGGVPTIKNFLDQEKTLRLVYPAHNELKEEDPTPINKHIKVDYYLPQCPPSKKEIVSFIRCIAKGEVWKDYNDPVCVECRSKGNPCLLDQNKICLGPITLGGCGALCPSNNVICYGCRGPFKDANLDAYTNMLKKMGYNKKEMHDKMRTFSGLQFREKEEEKTWLEK